MTPEEWWLQMIRSTMVGSGIKEEGELLYADLTSLSDQVLDNTAQR